MIKLRMDVDYPYPQRIKSFLSVLLNHKIGDSYLANSKAIARMVNATPVEIKAFWFFTPYTLPDQEMLALMRSHPERHEAALHIATNPYEELKCLEQTTKQKIQYYTIHGTSRLMARLMWRRNINQSRVPIPTGFPLKNFWDYPTLGLDHVCYSHSTEQATKIAEENISKGKVLHVHPEWLYHHGLLNHRGPYYNILKKILHLNIKTSYLCEICGNSVFLVRYNREIKKHVCEECDKELCKVGEIK